MAETNGAVTTAWPSVTAYERRAEAKPEPATQTVQAAAEGVVEAESETIEFLGQRFRLADSVGLMPLLAFANASKQGLNSDDMAGMAAMYAMIRGVVWRKPLYDEHGVRALDPLTDDPAFDETEWNRFERHAMNENADGEELMGFVGKAMAVLAARPRKRREISSDGSPPTSEKSRESSSSPVTRPDLVGLTPIRDVAR